MHIMARVGGWRVVLQDRSMTMKDGLSFQVSKFEVVKSDSLNIHLLHMARILGGLRKYFVCVSEFCWAERGQLLASAHFLYFARQKLHNTPHSF